MVFLNIPPRFVYMHLVSTSVSEKKHCFRMFAFVVFCCLQVSYECMAFLPIILARVRMRSDGVMWQFQF